MRLPGFEFGGTHSKDLGIEVLDVRRSLLASSRDVFEQVPGRPGSWHYPQEPGDRSVVAVVGYQADSREDFWAGLRLVAEWLRPTGRKRLVLDDDPDFYFWAVAVNAADVARELELGQAEVEFSADPYVYALAESSDTFALGASATVVNPGGIETPARVVVAATSGAVNDPAVSLGDESFSYDGSIPGGSALVVDAADVVSVVVADGAGALAGTADLSLGDAVDIQGDFPVLDPGPNALGSSPNTAGTVKVFWRQRRL